MTNAITVPHSADDITAQWLGSALGRDVRAAEVHRIAEGVGMLSELYRAELRGDDVPDSVIVKISTLNPEARASAVNYRMYEREVRFFQLLAPAGRIRTPHAFHADWDRDTNDSVVVMEDLTTMRPGDQNEGLTPEEAGLAIDQLAALHAEWWGDPTLEEQSWAGSLLDPTYYVGIPMGFEMLLPAAKQHFGHVLGPTIPILDRLHPHINALQEELCCGPNTILHGDFRGDNLLFGSTADHPPAVMIDFQAVVVGRGAMELGYFLGQSVTIEDRRAHERELIARYVDQLRAHGVDGYTVDNGWEDYRRSSLYCLSYAVLMAGLDMTDPPTFAKLEMMVERLSAAADDLAVSELLP